MPWLYARRVIASRWGIPPAEVEEYPPGEIQLELRIMAIEAECEPPPPPPSPAG